MDRKKFLSLTKKAVVASSIGGLLMSQKSFGQEVEEIVNDYHGSEYLDKYELNYSFSLNDKCLNKTAPENFRSFVLNVKRYERTKNDEGKEVPNYSTELEVDFKIDIIDVRENDEVLTKNKGGKMLLSCKKGSCIKGTEIETPMFPKHFLMSPLDDNSMVLCIDESGEFLSYMENVDNYNELEDCFITSACVGASGLADNCYELETLRSFRDNYIGSLPEGKQVIDNYYAIGPKIVSEINLQNDSKAIYQHIYNTLVVPSVALVEQNKNEEAFNFYKNYVGILAETVFA